MIINGEALGFHQKMNKTNEQLQKSLGKLAGGKRLTSAAVDSAGLAISEKLRALQKGSRQALQNVQDAQSLAQTADSAMQEMTDVVQRIRELTIQAMNGTNTDIYSAGTAADSLMIQNEIDELKKNLRDIVHNTEFNTKKLLSNTEPGDYIYANRQAGKNISATQSVSTNNAIIAENTAGSVAHTYIKEEKVGTTVNNIVESSHPIPPTEVNMSTVVDHLPMWSADGTSIIFSSTRDGQSYRIPADGSIDPVVNTGSATAQLRQTAGEYKLEAVGSSLLLQKKVSGYPSWETQKAFSYNQSDGLHGFSFSPTIDSLGNTSFVFSDNLGNISKVDMNVKTGTIGNPVSLISTTDRLNLPPQNNTLTLPAGPDLYRVSEVKASLVVKKATDTGFRELMYWDGIGDSPNSGYYTISGNQITFHGDAIIGKEVEDDAQDYYSIQYVKGNGSRTHHTESIPSGAQVYNMNGETGPMSLKISVGGTTVPREQYLSARPLDPENTTGVFVDKSTGKLEFYGELRPSATETVNITYMADADNDKNIQTHILPAEIDTYNLDSTDPAKPKPLEVYVGTKK